MELTHTNNLKVYTLQEKMATKNEMDEMTSVISEIVESHKELTSVVETITNENTKRDKILKDIENTSSHMLQQYMVDRIYYQDETDEIKIKLDRVIRNHDKEIDTIILAQANIQKDLKNNDDAIINMKNRIDLELEKTRDKMVRTTNKILIGLTGTLGVIGGLLITLINMILNLE